MAVFHPYEPLPYIDTDRLQYTYSVLDGSYYHIVPKRDPAGLAFPQGEYFVYSAVLVFAFGHDTAIADAHIPAVGATFHFSVIFVHFYQNLIKSLSTTVHGMPIIKT